MNRLNKTDSAIFVSLIYSLVPTDLHSEFILQGNSVLTNRINIKLESFSDLIIQPFAGRVAQSVARLTEESEVQGSIPGSATY